MLTFAPLRVVFKACDHLATTAEFCFTLETCLSNNLNYNLMSKKTSKCRKSSRDEAIKISPKQKFLKPL